MKIAICGMGRAGKVLARKILVEKQHKLVLILCREESQTRNLDVGELLNMPYQGIPVLSLIDFSKVYNKYDVDMVIDFSHIDTSLKLVTLCDKIGVNAVICTTNFSEKQKQFIQQICEKKNCGVVMASNLTLGINILIEFVEKMSKVLTGFDFEIIERHRKDKPRITTTAKMIAKAINRKDVPISSIRVGGYVGVHEVTAANENERITIIHESFSREAFADGALMAAIFLEKKKGYYTMSDVINELKQNI